GASGSADYSHSKINADYAAVTEQSGLFAGDDGYQVNVGGHTQLTGALITSTDKAEQTGKNQLTSGTIGFTDLHNHSNYKGEGVGIGADITQITGIGYGKDKGNDASTTHSGINTANINITNPDQQQQNISQLHTDVTTDNYAEHAGYLANNFDKDKVQHEIDTQVDVSKEFNQNSHAIVKDYVESRQAALRDKLKQAQTEEEKTALFDEIYKLQYQRRVLETLINMLSADPTLAMSQGTIQLAATKFREETLANSRKQPPIHGTDKDGNPLDLNNVSMESGYFDGVKLGGVRLDKEAICGNNNERCVPNSDGSLQYIGDAQFPKLSDVIDPKKNPDERIEKMYGATGGMQGRPGSMFGNYKPGSWQDIVVEGFAGTHDILGGQMWGWYSDLGNTSEGRYKPENHDNFWSGITTVAAIPAATPVAAADLIPQNVVQAIFKLLGH
ncbi:hemagglutinin, partial [Neisseriaceae bacterium ESL0693]|nr:hemagglutinin [Neisseriaceae bacterium ESL0693]